MAGEIRRVARDLGAGPGVGRVDDEGPLLQKPLLDYANESDMIIS